MTPPAGRITGVLVSVDYADLLAVTLPLNRPQFDRLVVVTSPADRTSAELAIRHACDLLVTDVFYERGATFNKGAALEQGLEFAGLGDRDGWFVVMDADVVIPRSAGLADAVRLVGPWAAMPGTLYSPLRHVLHDPRQFNPDPSSWHAVPFRKREEHAGYFQMFHGSDPVLDRRPWYPTEWRHAGGCDSEFWQKWPRGRLARPPFKVLHLGPIDTNWMGRASPYLDGTLPPDAAARAAQVERLLDRRTSPRPAGTPKCFGERIGEEWRAPENFA